LALAPFAGEGIRIADGGRCFGLHGVGGPANHTGEHPAFHRHHPQSKPRSIYRSHGTIPGGVRPAWPSMAGRSVVQPMPEGIG